MTDFLYQYFDNNPDRLMSKWMHYFPIYERHFGPYRDRPITLLEYGIYHGGSLQMWKKFFHPDSRIIGVDIDPRCASLTEPGIEVVIGDQEDPRTHAKLREKYGNFDIVIDDGGHTMRQQIETFKGIYQSVKMGGLYVAEDLHTSYMPKWGGGLGRDDTFIAFSKKLIDQLHAWYAEESEQEVSDITTSAYGLHYYDSMLIIDKQEVKHPTILMTGEPTFAMNALEYMWLAGHYREKGDLDRAEAFCQRALQLRPELPSAHTMLGKIAMERTNSAR